MNEQEKLRALGFDLGGGRLLPTVGDTPKVAMDAALQTAANVTVPALFATYYSPEVVEILQSPTLSTKIFGEEKRGEWKDLQTMFPAVEYVGQTTAYSDFGRGMLADVNIENVVRDTYRNQVFIQCGDFEEELVAAQKLNLLSEKQKAAARTLQIDSNLFNFYGVDGLSIYGLLNEPALPAAITPSLTASAILSRYMCPGMISLCAQTIPTMGFFISLSVHPSARISERWEDMAVPSEKMLFIAVYRRSKKFKIGAKTPEKGPGGLPWGRQIISL